MTAPSTPSRRHELLALAERVEATSGASITLEQATALAVHGGECSDVDGITIVDGHLFRVPAYTASLDAAMTLIPADHEWSVEWAGNSIGWIRLLPDGEPSKGYAATPALALTAAALRAIASLESNNV